MLWLLSQHPQIEAELIREVPTLSADFNGEDLKKLKLLDGMIDESLRLYPPVGQGLPRVVRLAEQNSKGILFLRTPLWASKLIACTVFPRRGPDQSHLSLRDGKPRHQRCDSVSCRLVPGPEVSRSHFTLPRVPWRDKG